MYTVRICSPGKTKEEWLQEALSLYRKRLLRHIKVDYIWVKDNEQLFRWAEKEKNVLLLDPKGKALTSEEFADYFFTSAERAGGHLSFIIGGAEGLPDKFLRFPAISLSKMIFTHQMTRLIITEQIYRAHEISKNSPYHFSSARVPRFSAKA